MELILERQSLSTEKGVPTLGRLVLIDENGVEMDSVVTIELPWLDNQKNISCIPEGIYDIVLRDASESGKFKYTHFHILGVENRSHILIHRGNYVSQLQGCVAVGLDFAYVNKDEIIDVEDSRRALNKMIGYFRFGITYRIQVILVH